MAGAVANSHFMQSESGIGRQFAFDGAEKVCGRTAPCGRGSVWRGKRVVPIGSGFQPDRGDF